MKQGIDVVSQELYHLKEGSREMQLLNNGHMRGVHRCLSDKQLKSFARLEVADEKRAELSRQTNAINVAKQETKLCAR